MLSSHEKTEESYMRIIKWQKPILKSYYMLCFQLYEIQENERLETVERSVAASAWLVGGEGWTGGSQRTSPGSWNTMYDTIMVGTCHCMSVQTHSMVYHDINHDLWWYNWSMLTDCKTHHSARGVDNTGGQACVGTGVMENLWAFCSVLLWTQKCFLK